MTLPDLSAILDSDAVQDAIPLEEKIRGWSLDKHKRDPYEDEELMDKLNPKRQKS